MAVEPVEVIVGPAHAWIISIEDAYHDLCQERNGCWRSSSSFTNSTTNQIFPILPDALIAELQQSYGFYIWSKADAGHSAIRLVTSWATPAEKVAEFIADVEAARAG